MPKDEEDAALANAEGVEVLPKAGAVDAPPKAEGVDVLPNAGAPLESEPALPPNADAVDPKADFPPPKAPKPLEAALCPKAGFPNAEAPGLDVVPKEGLDEPNADVDPNAGAELVGVDVDPKAGAALDPDAEFCAGAGAAEPLVGTALAEELLGGVGCAFGAPSGIIPG